MPINLIQRLSRLLRRPPREVALRIAAYAARQVRAFRLRSRDHFFTSYPSAADVPTEALHQLISKFSLAELVPWRESLRAASARTLEHRFDLLGSGSVVPGYDFEALGFEGHRYRSQLSMRVNLANLANVRRLRTLISADYQPIDWHLDFRSGYRWPANLASSRIAYGQLPGVDIKLPWELSRMQHLPQLALAFTDMKNDGRDAEAMRLVQEFQDQTLDFLASNPPRFGVNWSCTMDVAIRATNLLIAYDIFVSTGFEFPDEFETEFKRAILAHGRHIISNLEWFDDLRSNHYLSNIAGLLFVAAYLPPCPETDAWLALAANELGKEIFLQFQPDGSNFEGSTSYHRLSAEMVVFSVALGHRIAERLSLLDWGRCLKNIRISGQGMLPRDREIKARDAIESLSVVQYLANIGSFSRAITRPDGYVVQIGDNDSGRFVCLTPTTEAGEEDGNSHRILVDCIDALCSLGSPQRQSIDGMLIARLAKKATVDVKPAPASAGHEMLRFDNFGVYVMRSTRIWLAVRCGQVGQNGNGGHGHNDQLALELCTDGLPFLVDPGTYAYTPSPEMRNHFRSTRSHSTLSAEPGEQNAWLPGRAGLFSMSRVAKAQVVEANGRLFVGEHNGFESRHRRSITLHEDACEVIDECSAASRVLHFSLAPAVEIRLIDSGLELIQGGVRCRLEIPFGAIDLQDDWFSPGYGRKVKTRRIEVRDVPERCIWKFSLAPLHNV